MCCDNERKTQRTRQKPRERDEKRNMFFRFSNTCETVEDDHNIGR